MFRAEDMPRFRSGAGYQPLLIAEAAIPADLYAALISIRDMTASHAYGPEWRTVVRELSVQITRMQPGDDRGDHNDPVNQGEFISSYTAQGSCDIRLCYTTAESPPVGAPRSVKSPHRQQMVRRQEAGWYYSMRGLSLGSGTYHGVCAHAQGRLSVTFRFAAIAADAPSASPAPWARPRSPRSCRHRGHPRHRRGERAGSPGKAGAGSEGATRRAEEWHEQAPGAPDAAGQRARDTEGEQAAPYSFSAIISAGTRRRG